MYTPEETLIDVPAVHPTILPHTGGYMIYLDEATKNWATNGAWKIAPAGLDWIKKGSRIIVGKWARIGEGASIGERASIGEGASIGASSSEAIDLGWADGYRKCIAQVDGVAYIGAGCRWFTLAAALKHWGARDNRIMTMCLMQSAIYIAGYKGWAHE